eukprot:TRINITY_DN2893_c0_g1_i1.p1 TRINITY_DN2893_c0_g1~~TRINITY_DN2893_c0_g1_i1.p1  ORF type:complete len:219 (-),score=38.86 TRINITY_DN2893_c0_g1_i1:142-798(-)
MAMLGCVCSQLATYAFKIAKALDGKNWETISGFVDGVKIELPVIIVEGSLDNCEITNEITNHLASEQNSSSSQEIKSNSSLEKMKFAQQENKFIEIVKHDNTEIQQRNHVAREKEPMMRERGQLSTQNAQLTRERDELKKVNQEKENKIMELEKVIAQLQRVMQFIQDLPSDDLLTIKQLGFNEINTQLLNFSNNMKKELTENRSPRSHEARPSLTIY